MLKNVAVPVHTDVAFSYGASAVTDITPVFWLRRASVVSSR